MYDTRSNLTFSPMCIAAALAMTWVGAKDDTARQIWDVLELGVVGEEEEVHQAFHEILQMFNSNNEVYGATRSSRCSSTKSAATSSRLCLANRFYIDESYPILDEFSDTLANKYLSEVGRLDFGGDLDKCRRDINKWVEDMTENNVRDLVQKGNLNSSTKMVLINAIHFKGSWIPRFHPDKIHTGPFYRKKFENAINITMMETKGVYPYTVDYDFKCKVVELPYSGSHQYLLMFLPLDIEGLPTFENKLTPEMIKFMKKSMTKTKLTVVLPQIVYRQATVMSPVLKRMGIEDLFHAERADLSGITGTRELHFFEFIHSVFLDATDGNRPVTPTLAHGKTAITRGSRSNEMTFIADHPFFFVIYDRPSKLSLFIGRFNDPTAISFSRDNDNNDADDEMTPMATSDITVKVDTY